ncbi:MAG: glycosyltransferase family 39 protein [Acidobacteria bacterium]|nr:MAG: glycosyltransferase family 39 protein [Acidobacteriota bacterium]
MNPLSGEILSNLCEAVPANTTGRKIPAVHFVVLMVVAACMFFVGIGRLALIEPDEGRNAEVAREMLARGDWITPHFNNFAYLDKPPVFFWAVASTFKVAGLSEASARFPSALAALLTVFFAWVLARRMFETSTALYAGIVLSTSPLVVIFARDVIFDMMLTLFVTGAMVCYWLREAGSENQKLLDILFFAALGLATLTKGPVGFLLPLLSIAVYQALRRKFSRLKDLNWLVGLAAFFAITLPWFIAVSVRHPDFPGYAFWQESLQRFATGHSHRTGHIYYYFIIYLAGFLPWSFFLLYAAVHRARRWRDLQQEQHAPTLFLLSWAGVVFVFFTISQSKLPGYFLPAMVPLGILMAKVWTGPEPRKESRTPDWLTGGFATLIALGIIVAAAPHFQRFLFPRGHLETKMPHEVFVLLGPTLLYSGVILAALGVIGRNLCSRAREKNPTVIMFVLLACCFPLMLVRWFRPLELFASAKSSRALAQTILASPQRNYPIYGYYYFRTGLPFYLRRPIGLISSTADELTSNYIVTKWPGISREAENGQLPQNLFPPEMDGMPLVMDKDEWLAKRPSTPVLVLVRNIQVAQMASAVREMNPMWTGWQYSVWEIPAGSGPPSAPGKSN